MDENLTMYDYALQYATNYGFYVFPCDGKTPAINRGYLNAKRDSRVIAHWWKKLNPDFNIAIACEQSGLLVVDLDKDDEKGKDGFHELQLWEREHGVKLPETATVITGRGGLHLYYRFNYDGTDDDPKNRSGVLDGVDIRANGYVIAPPSLHPNGNYYEWEGSEPESIEDIALADEAVLMLCKYGLNANGKEDITLTNEPIPDGKRNETLFKHGCSLQSKGYPDETIAVTLRSLNNSRCSNPLTDAEMEKLIHSVISGYPKGIMRTFVGDQEWHEPEILKNDKGKTIQSIHNATQAIQFDKELYQRIKYNDLANTITIYGNLPWDVDADNSRKYREWKNVDDSNLLNYLQEQYGLINEKQITHALAIVANKFHYNPIKTFLEQCHELYQGGNYVRRLLPKYLGVEDTDYTYEVMRLFMMGAVCRIYNPGAKFDYVPIIVGEQGVGKSAFLRVLAGSDDWFDDNFNTLEGDKAAEKLRGMWILEIAELSAMKRTKDAETIKAFVTSRSDNYRAPYSKRAEKHKRMCVFAGTTNDRSFLTDTTGNRRFLPLVSNREQQQYMILDVPDEARQDVLMAWGEIMSEFMSLMERHIEPELKLPAVIQREAEEKQTEFLEEDIRVGMIQEYLDTHPDVTRVSAAFLYEQVIDGTKVELTKNKRISNELNTIMESKIQGWKYVGYQRVGHYGKSKAYERTSVPADYT